MEIFSNTIESIIIDGIFISYALCLVKMLNTRLVFVTDFHYKVLFII